MQSPAEAAAERALSWCDREPVHVPGAVQGYGGLLAYDAENGRVRYRSDNVASLLEVESEPLGATVDELLGAEARDSIEGAVDARMADLIPLHLDLPSGGQLDATAHRSDGLVIVELERVVGIERRAALHEVRRTVQRLELAVDVAEACEVAAQEVRRLTGFARVMVYRFHEDEHGEVVAEARRPHLESFLGLHYPASDIPLPARRLLRLSPVRVIADVDGPTVPIVGLGVHEERPLDLSRSTLRAIAPVHLQYLRNMGVGASLTLSLGDGPRLWGLIACHHDAPRLASPDARSACSIVARALWTRIAARERLDDQLQTDRSSALSAHLLGTLSSATSLAEALVEDGRTLLELAGAGGVYLRVDDVTTSLGATPPREVVGALVERISGLAADVPLITDHSGELFADLGLDDVVAAGILAAPVGRRWREHIIWFRGEEQQPYTWAGDPAKPTERLRAVADGHPGDDGALGPRTSFAAWRETRRGRSRGWTAPDVAAASALAGNLAGVRAARARDALALQALRDSLTGLPNRALLLDRIDVALAELRRSGTSVCLMFLDLDGFKGVNDNLGHETGDGVLVEVAARLRSRVRATDTVARLGGDEFVVLCTDATDEAMDRLAGELVDAIAQPIVVEGHRCAVTASIGLADADPSMATAGAALRAADLAMYRAKRLGRGRAVR